MSSYRLSVRAEQQLIEIYIATDEAFGRLQADAYLLDLRSYLSSSRPSQALAALRMS